ncbi:MAG: AAA family ATPase [Candidatus Margulisbacteria bacterium]|nr:AAA family ATPase [Candidatus Margulisiibacteriota bacterium]
MKNPFRYGKPVTGEYFFKLNHLEKELDNYIKSALSVAIVGPRRFGKTSFLKNYLCEKREKGFAVIEIDAFNVVTHKDFLTQLINAIAKEKGAIKRFTDWLGEFKNIRSPLSCSANPSTGEMSISVELGNASESDTKQAILLSMDSMAKLSKKLIVSIDEFQRIGELDDGRWLEATLRSKMQEHDHVAFIFTGSRRSIIEEMFNHSSRPFYRSCKMMFFPLFGPEFTDWIVRRFSNVKINCDRLAIQYLREQVEDTPHYVQEVCFHLVSHGIKSITHESVDDVINIISSQSSYTYESLLNILTPTQIKILRMLVLEGRISYSKYVRNKYELKSASYIQSGIKSLVDKQIIEKDPGTRDISFDDPMFKIWLSKKLR